MSEAELGGALVTALQSGGNAALITLALLAWRAGSTLVALGHMIGERLARIEKALQKYMQE